MSVLTNSILKLLSDLSAASDNTVEETGSELGRVSEWAVIVKNKAASIAESQNPASESGQIPSLTSFLRGRSRRGPRVSTVLTEIQKSQIHRKGKTSIKAGKYRKSSIKTKTPLRRKSYVKDKTIIIDSEEDTPKLPHKSSIKTSLRRKTIIIDSGEDTPKLPHKKIDAGPLLNQNASSSTSSVEGKQTPLGSFETPPAKGTTSLSKMDRSSKRKSSTELSLETVKKPKINYQLSDPKEKDKSMHTQISKVEKPTKAKNSSLLANYANLKSSVGAAPNVSVLKENRTLRSKMETKQEKAVENRKNLFAIRQLKLEQNKRTREEKLEKTIQQRMKLEKEKLSKLRSGGGQEKTLKTSNKEATPKANVENKTLKGPPSNSGKIKEKQSKKEKASTSILKSNEKTPAMKNPKHETEKILNTTFVTQGHEPSTSGKKGKALKDPNIGNNSENTKGVSYTNDVKAAKTVPKTVKLLNEQKKQLIGTPIQKKSPESYAITPTRESFVGYDISEIRSDSEDEEPAPNSKPIPSWATGVRFRNTLLQQRHHPIDTDELFGNVFNPPDLTEIMGVKKKRYNKRTSSAVWNSSFLS